MTLPSSSQPGTRRDFLETVSGAAVIGALSSRTSANDQSVASPLENAQFLGDKFVGWQAAYGGPDPAKCPYRTPGKFDAFHMHGCGPMSRALYRLFEATGNENYKTAADRYALFLINALHDPPTPFTNTIEIAGVRRTSLS